MLHREFVLIGYYFRFSFTCPFFMEVIANVVMIPGESFVNAV